MTDTDAQLPAPPRNDYVRFMPLGGLDEVGLNCALIETDDSMLMVDCGYTFPGDDAPGVDYVLPDWTYVRENLDRLEGILLTHAHQDHIGGLPYFLRDADVPLFGSDLTLHMVESQLEERGLDDVKFVRMGTAELVDIGPFTVEFVHVNHSIPDARAIVVETPLGPFLFTGDWKLDQTPRDEPVADLQTFADLAREDLVGLFGDSTNAEVPGTSASELDVFENVERVLTQAEGRVIVSQFSSNLYRLQGLMDLAWKHGRKVFLVGRSIRDNVELGREQGFIDVPGDDLLLQPHEAKELPDEQVLVVATGSQAEPRAALTRMSRGDHHHVSISEDDTVVISARIIPGNGPGIHDMVDDLVRRGAEVVQAGDEPIHGSGHACADELKMMLNLTRPEYLVPVHGRYRMREAHAELGYEVGVPEQFLIENGDVLEFTHDGAEVVGRIPTGRVLVDGKNIGDLEDVQLRDRAELADSGLVVAYVVIDKGSGEMVGDIELAQHGFLGHDEQDRLESATDRARSALNNLSSDARRDPGEVKSALRTSVRDYFRRELDRQPVVIPVVQEA